MKDQITDNSQLRLTIEIVPSTLWGKNLRKMLSQPAWDKLRRQVYEQYGNRCGICQAEGRLSCHEIWDYDDIQHIQKLQGFIALCDMCDYVKHIGFAETLAASGKLDLQQVINHFLKVNQCSQEEYEAHYKEAWETWSIRSNEFDWTTDLGEYAHLGLRVVMERKTTLRNLLLLETAPKRGLTAVFLDSYGYPYSGMVSRVSMFSKTVPAVKDVSKPQAVHF